MPTYKLYYFDGRARAEVTRYIFAQAGEKYEDVRLTGEQFGEMKPDLPASSLPVLEVDGEKLAGSGVIARYVAEKFGLAGSNEWENAQIASFIDVLDDLYGRMFACYFGGDEDSRAAAKKQLVEQGLPKYLSILEKRIKANDSPDGWAYGKKLTYADLRVYDIIDTVVLGEKLASLDEYPAVKKCNEAVKAQPRIAEWVKNRPQTPW